MNHYYVLQALRIVNNQIFVCKYTRNITCELTQNLTVNCTIKNTLTNRAGYELKNLVRFY